METLGPFQSLLERVMVHGSWKIKWVKSIKTENPNKTKLSNVSDIFPTVNMWPMADLAIISFADNNNLRSDIWSCILYRFYVDISMFQLLSYKHFFARQATFFRVALHHPFIWARKERAVKIPLFLLAQDKLWLATTDMTRICPNWFALGGELTFSFEGLFFSPLY